MMSNYVIDVYVSSNPDTYMVRIRFTVQNRVWHKPIKTLMETNGQLNLDIGGKSVDQ
jgi:hypothetical protein